MSSSISDTSYRSPKRPEPSRARSSYHSDVHLLNPHARRDSKDGLRSQLGGFCHTLKLNVVYGLTSNASVRRKEKRKNATYKHRGHTILRYIIHILPVAAALVLVVLNCTQYYIGGELAGPDNEDTERFGGLLFAAKLHEFLMLASLGTIIFTYIRRELASGTGIPLRALFVGVQINSISWLWSPEFLGIMCHKWKANRKRKAVLIAIVLVCTLLGVSVGISSAALIRPRLDSWPAGGTSFWINANSDVLSPQTIEDSSSLEHCAFDTGDAGCPYGDWQLIQQEYHAFWPHLFPMGSMPLHIDIPSPFSLRTMRIFQRSSSDDWTSNLGSIWGGHFSLATVPTSPIADGLAEVARLWARAVAATRHDRFQWREDVQFTTKAPQSSVYTRCSETIIDVTQLDALRLSFPALAEIQFADGNTFDGTVEQIGFHTDSSSDTATTVKSLLAGGLPPALTWVDEGDMLTNTNSTLLAIATFPVTTDGTSNLYTCSIDSRLTQTDVTTFRNEYKLVSGVPPNWANGTVASPWPKIMPTAAWARYLNPTILGSNVSAFSNIASAAGMWNTSLVAAPYNFAIIVEGILTTMVANGLGRASYNTSMIGNLKGNDGDSNQWYSTGWFEYFFAKTSVFDLSPEEQASATEFTMSASVIGYAYGYKGATQKAAIAVLLAYIILTVLHFGCSIWAGWASTSRDTQPKIAMMAMNSEETEVLDDIGTGTAVAEGSEENVRMRARGRDIELSLDDAQNNALYIRRSTGYG